MHEIRHVIGEDAAADVAAKRDKERRRFHAQRPKAIRNVLAQLIQKRGYGRPQLDQQLQQAWCDAAGPSWASLTHAARVQRGNLEVVVANSTVMQELSFDRERILNALRDRLPEARIRALRFRIGVLPAS
jgi:hypothetical protein